MPCLLGGGDKQALNRNDTWFRKGGFTSTLCVPPTPGGALAKLIGDNLKNGRQANGTKTKIVEGNGLSSGQEMTKSDQFPQEECHRADCAICVRRDGENNMKGQSMCMKSSVGYEGECVRCDQTIFKYIGETSKTGYSRIKQHLSDYRAAHAAKLPPPPSRHGTAQIDLPLKDVKSWMWEHTRGVHGGLMGGQGGLLDYKFNVSGTFRKCLQRQVDEGLRMRIAEDDGKVLLNSKNEWFTPRLVVPAFRQE